MTNNNNKSKYLLLTNKNKHIGLSIATGTINGFLFAILFILFIKFYLGPMQTKNNFKNLLEINKLFIGVLNTNIPNIKDEQYPYKKRKYDEKFNNFLTIVSIIGGILIIISLIYIYKYSYPADRVDILFEILVIFLILLFNILYFNIISKNYILYNIGNDYLDLVRYYTSLLNNNNNNNNN